MIGRIVFPSLVIALFAIALCDNESLDAPSSDRTIMNTHYNTILKQPRKAEGRFAHSNRSLEPIIFVPGSFTTLLLLLLPHGSCSADIQTPPIFFV